MLLVKVAISIVLAWWFQKEIPSFAVKLNQQIYQEYTSLIAESYNPLDYVSFQNYSKLQPKRVIYTKLFFILFPIIFILVDDLNLAIILVVLCFLSLLDICYYLTDIKYIALIFIYSIALEKNIDTFLFCAFFFIFIHFISLYLLKKDGFGIGDSLILLAISPLFDLNTMLWLILISTLSGILYYVGYLLITKQKLMKLPFIPFITLSTFTIIIAKI